MKKGFGVGAIIVIIAIVIIIGAYAFYGNKAPVETNPNEVSATTTAAIENVAAVGTVASTTATTTAEATATTTE